MQNRIVSRDEWLVARKQHLVKEKEYTRLRDQLSQSRRELPWVKVEKEYLFDGPNGKQTLSALFENRSQLMIYHFMFGPDWEEGCPSCSYISDQFDGIGIHLNHRDITLTVVSKARFDKLEAYRKRMGWQFKWMSSFESDFNDDYQVSFSPDQKEDERYYNYVAKGFPAEEAPGISVFYKNEQGDLFHTYSSYGRGLDMLIGAYHFMDLVPKGRDEDGKNMAWLRRHDQYDDPQG